MIDLNSIWFGLVGLLFIGYAILDGFDLGVGTLHLFTHTDSERRLMMNSIGPVWDGNEVWLVTGGGALFAAFPEVYATAFSAFYIPLMLLLFALIFRAVAIEFRSKRDSKRWHQTWDYSFAAASILGSLLIGVALGNIAWGIPLNENYVYTGGLFDLLNPYALLVGVTTIALFMMHGAIYVTLKTEGEMHDKVRSWINNTIIFFIICYATTTMATLLYVPHMADNIRENPPLFALPLLNMLAIANIPREVHHGNDFRAFLSSAFAMLFLLVLFGVDMFPNIILSSIDPAANSLTIYNAASSQKTLGIMGIFALIGIPLVLGYTFTIYWVFRGKVKLDKSSY